MSQKKQGEDKLIMKHILELRFKKISFSFLDFKGEMIDQMVKSFGAEKIRLQTDGNRVDLADDKVEHQYFFSLQNFGFQIEIQHTIKDFEVEVKKFLAAVKETENYNFPDGFARIGTKSMILLHRRADTMEDVKNAYKNILIQNEARISELTEGEIIDTAHTFDLKLKNSTVNVTTGPVTKDEALTKFFAVDGEVRKAYENSFTKNNGLFFSIDVAGDKPESFTDWEKLETQVLQQIGDIETVFEGFRSYFANTSE